VCLQASWLYVVCAVTVASLAAVMYLVIARRGETFLRRRLEARLEEREREARELNDTLIQGLQGLILRFQAVCERIPPREPARELMERALERADRMLVDTRDGTGDGREAEQQVR
jgi:signal transduction histidine kinase